MVFKGQKALFKWKIQGENKTLIIVLSFVVLSPSQL